MIQLVRAKKDTVKLPSSGDNSVKSKHLIHEGYLIAPLGTDACFSHSSGWIILGRAAGI